MKDKIAMEIWKLLDGKIEALYLAGSRAIGAQVASSDIDYFGIVNSEYDFSGEDAFNTELSQESSEKVNFRGIDLGELQGGPQRGIITRYVPLPILLKSFPFWQHLQGRDYELDDFTVKPATPQVEAHHYIARLARDRHAAQKGGLPYEFKDYTKAALFLIGADEQMQGHQFTPDFREIAERAPPEAAELAGYCMLYRNGEVTDKAEFFRKLDSYMADMRRM